MGESNEIHKLKLRIHFLAKRVLELEKQVNDIGTCQKEKLSTSNLEKKEEALQALSYLKSKEVKTKQDQISIYTLEVVLKGLK
jgi:hypothetical protein